MIQSNKCFDHRLNLIKEPNRGRITQSNPVAPLVVPKDFTLRRCIADHKKMQCIMTLPQEKYGHSSWLAR